MLKPYHLQIHGRPFCERMANPVYRAKADTARILCCSYRTLPEACDAAAALVGAGQVGVAVAFGVCRAVSDLVDA